MLANCTRFLIIASAALMASAANAGVTVNITQSGPDVVATASGSLDLSGLSFSDDGVLLVEGIEGDVGYVALGAPAGGLVTGYLGLIGPADFGSGGFFASSTFTGTLFALNASELGLPTFVYVPDGYVSGDPISSTASWLGQTFASLGLTEGQYVYSSAYDSVTINIGGVSGAVPEPATWAMMLLGFGTVGFAMRRRRRVPTSLATARA